MCVVRKWRALGLTHPVPRCRITPRVKLKSPSPTISTECSLAYVTCLSFLFAPATPRCCGRPGLLLVRESPPGRADSACAATARIPPAAAPAFFLRSFFSLPLRLLSWCPRNFPMCVRKADRFAVRCLRGAQVFLKLFKIEANEKRLWESGLLYLSRGSKPQSRAAINTCADCAAVVAACSPLREDGLMDACKSRAVHCCLRWCGHNGDEGQALVGQCCSMSTATASCMWCNPVAFGNYQP